LLRQRLPSDQHYVKAGFKLRVEGAHNFAQTPSNPVACHRAAYLFANDQSVSVMRSLVWRKTQDQQMVTVDDAYPTQALKILRPAQTQILPHLMGVPVHLLDMRRRDCQQMTPFGAASLENLAPPTSRHASAKAVYASTTANLRLICALC
jgi:hypothetical protein